MSRRGVVTHAYRMPGGWEKVRRRRRLTREYAGELTAQGYTMVRTRRGLFRHSEVALSWYHVPS